jgi:hypothetical protein
MKTKKMSILSGVLVIGFWGFMIAGIFLPVPIIAQTEPCTVAVTVNCNGSTDCSGFLGGFIDVKNTGTTVITCQVTSGFGSGGTGGGTGGVFEPIVLLSPGETYRYGWVDVPIECGYSHEIHSSGQVEAHCQVGCNPDAVCEDSAAWQCSATCEGTAPIDIKPGSCPNTISLREKGTLAVAIMGGDDLDVAKIDTASIRLSRQGIADTVAPISWVFKEMGSPFEGELCDCDRSKRDGYTDMVLTFDIQQVLTVLGFDKVIGQTLPLTMTGRMEEACDGRTFIKSIMGRDCILIQR